MKFAVDKEITSIKNTLRVVYLNPDEPALQLVAECIFSIAPDSWLEMRKPDGTVVVPTGFLQHLGSITVGTTRGVLFEKTQGPHYGRYVMPLVNVSEMVKEDMVLTPTKSE